VGFAGIDVAELLENRQIHGIDAVLSNDSEAALSLAQSNP
jgi:hypothetical protein